ncbi:nudix hydrolase [Klebsiella phage K64-1]|uniref:nudix hydrolase n=1 Tax=Klebsiella phage K64-1 TaxID=1439894 RepID=UPI00248CFB89|nr:nudix hydrolase [Klebsiella phage K64-1]
MIMGYQLFLDDIRYPSKYYSTEMVLCRSYDEAVKYVEEHGIPEFISFDHDLGDTSDNEKTGYSFAKFLIDYMIDNGISNEFKYNIHSSNPVGADNIDSYLKAGFKYLRENM